MPAIQPGVEVGQIWADNDKRTTHRYLRVLSIDDGTALVKQVHLMPPGGWAPTTKAPTRVRLDRLRPTSTGYRLVQHADGSEA